MKGLKKKRRIQVIAVAAVALLVSTALIGYALRDGINFFRSPTEVVETPPRESETFRIGGLVEDGSLKVNESQEITFNVTDGNAVVAVTYKGILPDLFEEGQGMVGTGRYIEGVFQASEILAKHDEKYMPVEVIDALKEQGVYKEANGS
ncbi:cytochrome c-type biogenesis protein CcmE [Litoreibacter halocynthiae]|uniref:Cytochrome c-type biogenesis protein CcmE n=2 Tax=Litoreibacter TaxID=947567 RepID=A0A4R7LRU9_9RHOB|nr:MULTISPECIES: cytochrome c maturation protein CcmE [Litoreibacter]TDT77746.1 cytochrome c-type biogenesis protein CcmE [Litoreibacter halocynthiae]SHE75281.1 cytochrome c-type biogenesis protein CcmE [Litoreibacter ascidiaceicola]